MIVPPPTSYKHKRWDLACAAPDATAKLAQDLRVPPIVATVLQNRSLADRAAATAFLEPKYKDLHSPWLLPNMEPAAQRIAHAVRQHEKITLYGDYDVDGITGTTMLWHTLKEAGADVDYYIPHRVDEGYGVNTDAVKAIAKTGTKLLITVDCGCSAVEPIAAARELGMDVVVSDHHEFGAVIPNANAIVHPRLSPQSPVLSTPYPNADLCGAGVAFKLCWAVAQKLCNAERVSEAYKALLMEFAALAALGTIADVVPLCGENRILVKFGLQQLARTKIPGLAALIHAAGYGTGEKKLDCMAVGFGLAPRLNAAGRMDHANEAVELLTTATGARAEEIATNLESANRERQATERKMIEVARAQIENQKSKIENLDHVLVVAHESFHAGVVGIVASRLVDLYARPAFVLARSGEELHGSARSVTGFELHEAIEATRDLLTSGGGHAMAGGVKLAGSNFTAFCQRLNAYGRENLTEEMLTPSLAIDGILAVEECVPAVIGHLDRLAPFGRGNPQPRFLIENMKLSAPPRRVGASGTHLQLTISRGRNVLRCIAFKMGDLEPHLAVGMELNLVVEPKVDEWNGRERVDLVVCDVARADGTEFAH